MREEMRNAHAVLVGKFQRKKRRNRWKDNIKMKLTDIDWEDEDWIQLNQNGVHWQASMNTLMDFRFLLKTRNVLTSWATAIF
jgi:hypothetical protein